MVLDSLPKLKLEKIKIKKDRTFCAIILNAKTSLGEIKLLGREAKYWVKSALMDIPTKIVDYDKGMSILDAVRDKIDVNYDYTFVLLSTTVLLEEKDISMLKDYAMYKGIGLCKLPVGYIINNQYFVDAKNPQVDSVYTGDIDNFYIVENKKQIKYATEILQDRINNFHIGNGVEIIKSSSVYIEPEVDIESGVTIYPHVSLMGNTKVMENCIIKDGASIVDSVVGKGSFIGKSVIEKCNIGSNVCIASFCELKDSRVGNDATIDSNCSIQKTRIKSKEKIKAGSIIEGK